MQHFSHQKTRRVMLVAFFVLVLAVLGGTLALAMATGGTISGTVTSPLDPLPDGTVVKLFHAGSDFAMGQAAVDSGTGAFSIGPVGNGLYVLKAVPPVSSGLTQSELTPVSVLGGAVSGVSLSLTEPQISGTVFAPDGTTPVTATVKVFAAGHTVLQSVFAPLGEFAIGGLPVGNYDLVAFPETDDPYWKSEPVPAMAARCITCTLTLTHAQLWGVAKDSLGNPVRGATVIAAQMASSGAPVAVASDRTSASGFWAIGGLPNGTYGLGALPPYDRNELVPPAVQMTTIPGASNPFTITFGTSQKIVSGSVMVHQAGSADLPVQNALVIAHRMDRHGEARTFTGADGRYQMQLSSGLWAMTVKPVSTTVPSDWVFNKPPQLVFFEFNKTPENKTQNFTVLAADATVIGSVVLPGGTVVLPSDPVTVTVAIFNNEGVGRHADIQAGESFTITLPSGGYKVVVHSHNPQFMGPQIDPIFVEPNSTFDLGAITLITKDAAITGTVKDESGNGVVGITVAAWRDGTPEILRTDTAPDGSYILPVVGGDWHVRPAPRPNQPYIYNGGGTPVSLASGETVADVNFTLTDAPIALNGVLVDESGNTLSDVDGWAVAQSKTDPNLHNGAPIKNGEFAIFVPAGTYRVAAHPAGGSEYMSSAEREVTVDNTWTGPLTLTVKLEDATISGALWNPRTETVVTGVEGAVGAWMGNDWTASRIDPGNGTYKLNVAAGLWHLGYRIDPTANYLKLAKVINVPVAAGQNKVVPLPVVEKDAAITGTVLAPDGSPLGGALVLAHGIHTDVTLHTRSRDDGTFNLRVPAGRYRLGAANGNPAWIKPVEVEVVVGAGETSGGHTLQFQLPDVTISGALAISGTTGLNGNALVWAWSDDGGFVKGRFPITNSAGSYSIGVISNTTWHVGAAFETDTQFWATRQSVDVGSSSATLDLTLTGPHAKPGPVVVTFDAADPQRIVLADGTHIYIPAGAMPVTGEVTLRVVPIATLPHQRHAPNTYGYGYAFLATDSTGQPIESHFNQDVVIGFRYDDAEIARQGIFEPRLKPAYFSTTENSWTFPDSYAVDTVNNIVTMQIDHFTDFVLTAEPPVMVYLPLVMK